MNIYFYFASIPQFFEREEEELAKNFVEGGVLEKYKSSSLSDYSDEFSSLPAGMNPLDPGKNIYLIENISYIFEYL